MSFLLWSSLFIGAYAAPTTSPQAATVFSLQYGYPIPAWQKLATAGVDVVGTNEFLHASRLATAADTNIVRPNTDTLYSQLFYDLSAGDLEITIPDVPDDQFKLFSFFDVFGDNYASVGTGGFYEAGKYLLRPLERSESGAIVGLKTLTDKRREGIVTSPNLYGILLIRWLVNETNIDEIHQWQNETGVKFVPCSKADGTPLTDILARYDESADIAENVMNLLPFYVPAHVPKGKFRRAGIDFASDSWTKPESVDFEVANSTAFASIMATGQSPKFLDELSNGWSVISPDYVGDYGTEYAFRSLVAFTAYLANASPYAVYPSWSNESSEDAKGEIDVGSNEAILFTFSSLPQLKAAGFWSLTAYNSDLYLIDNPEDTYSLGDRSNLTYPDGEPLYFGGANFPNNEHDGPFQILIQPADVEPPSNWTDNWLPSPAGGGGIVTTLRWYNAEDNMIDGSYEYPTVERISAITA